VSFVSCFFSKKVYITVAAEGVLLVLVSCVRTLSLHGYLITLLRRKTAPVNVVEYVIYILAFALDAASYMFYVCNGSRSS